LRYADDMILACSEIQLQELVDRLVRVSGNYELLINAEKTKIITTDGSSCNIDINNILVEKVASFTYLGSLITDDAECTKDIRGRLAKDPGIGANLKKIWQNHGIRISTKIRLMKALAMYGCESWTLKKDDERRIGAFEMKCLSQVLTSIVDGQED